MLTLSTALLTVPSAPLRPTPPAPSVFLFLTPTSIQLCVWVVLFSLAQDSVHRPQLLKTERRGEADSNRGPSAYQPNALPLGQTGSLGTINISSATVLTLGNKVVLLLWLNFLWWGGSKKRRGEWKKWKTRLRFEDLCLPCLSCSCMFFPWCIQSHVNKQCLQIQYFELFTVY